MKKLRLLESLLSSRNINLLFGLIFGLIILIVVDLGGKWIQAMVVGAIFALFILVKSFNSRVLISSLVLMMVFNIGIYLFKEPFYRISESHGVPGLQVSAAHMILGVLLIKWILSANPRPHINSSIKWLILFLFVVCLSTLCARHPYASLLETYRICIMVILSIYCYSNIKDKETVTLICNTFLITIVIEAVITLFQYLGYFPSSSLIFGGTGTVAQEMGLSEIVRPMGTFIHPDKFAIYLALVIPLTVSSAIAEKRPIMVSLKLIVILLALCTLFFSQARAAWIGVAVGLVVLFFLLWRTKMNRISLFTIYLVALAVISVAIPTIIVPRFILSDMGSAESRIPMALNALRVIEKYPLLGVGPNNYCLESVKYAPSTLDKSMVGWPVHNVYLLITAENGIIAIILFLGFCIIVIKNALRFRPVYDMQLTSIKYGMGAGILSYLTANFFNGHYVGEEILFFFMCQVVMICEDLLSRESDLRAMI